MSALALNAQGNSATEDKSVIGGKDPAEEEKKSDSTSSDKWRCNGCGFESPLACRFCGVCGGKKPAEGWWCVSCEIQQPALHKFCSGCGCTQEDSIASTVAKLNAQNAEIQQEDANASTEVKLNAKSEEIKKEDTIASASAKLNANNVETKVESDVLMIGDSLIEDALQSVKAKSSEVSSPFEVGHEGKADKSLEVDQSAHKTITSHGSNIRNEERIPKSSKSSRRNAVSPSKEDVMSSEDEAKEDKGMDHSISRRTGLRGDKSRRGARSSSRGSLPDLDKSSRGTRSRERSSKKDASKYAEVGDSDNCGVPLSKTRERSSKKSLSKSAEMGDGDSIAVPTDKSFQDQGGEQQLDASWRFPRSRARSSVTDIDKPQAQDIFGDSDTSHARQLFMDEADSEPALDFTPLVVDQKASLLRGWMNDESESEGQDGNEGASLMEKSSKGRQGRGRDREGSSRHTRSSSKGRGVGARLRNASIGAVGKKLARVAKRSMSVHGHEDVPTTDNSNKGEQGQEQRQGRGRDREASSRHTRSSSRGHSVGAKLRNASIDAGKKIASAAKRSSSLGGSKRSGSRGAKRSSSLGSSKRGGSRGARKRSESNGPRKRSKSRGARRRGPSVGASKRSNGGDRKRSASASARGRLPGRSKSSGLVRNKGRGAPGRANSESAARAKSRSTSPKKSDASSRGPRSTSRLAKSTSDEADSPNLEATPKRGNRSVRGARSMDSRSMRTGRTIRGVRTTSPVGGDSADPVQASSPSSGGGLRANPHDSHSTREKSSIDDSTRGNQTTRGSRLIDATFRELSTNRAANTKSVRGNRTRLPAACPLLNCSCASCNLKRKEGESNPRHRSASPARPTNSRDKTSARKPRSMSPNRSKGLPAMEKPKIITERSKSTGTDVLLGEESTVGRPSRQRPSEFTTSSPASLARGKSTGSSLDESWLHFSVTNFSASSEEVPPNNNSSFNDSRNLSRKSLAERLSKGSISGLPLQENSSLPPLISHDSVSTNDDEIMIFRSSLSSAELEESKIKLSYSEAPKSSKKPTIGSVPKRGGSMVDSGMLDNSSLLDHSDGSTGRRATDRDPVVKGDTPRFSTYSMLSIDSTVSGLSRDMVCGPVTIVPDPPRNQGGASRLNHSASLADLSARKGRSLSPRKGKSDDHASSVKQSVSFADLSSRKTRSLSPRLNRDKDEGGASHLKIATGLAELRARAGRQAAAMEAKAAPWKNAKNAFLDDDSPPDTSKNEQPKSLQSPRRRGQSPLQAISGDMDRSCPSHRARTEALPISTRKMKKSTSFDNFDTTRQSAPTSDRFRKDPAVKQKSKDAVNVIANSWGNKGSSKEPGHKNGSDNPTTTESPKRSSSRAKALNEATSPSSPPRKSRSKSPKSQVIDKEVAALAATDAFGLIASSLKSPRKSSTTPPDVDEKGKSAKQRNRESASLGVGLPGLTKISELEARKACDGEAAASSKEDQGMGSPEPTVSEQPKGDKGAAGGNTHESTREDEGTSIPDATNTPSVEKEFNDALETKDGQNGPSGLVSQRMRMSASLQAGIPPASMDTSALSLKTQKTDPSALTASTTSMGDSKAAMIAGLANIASQQGDLGTQVAVAPNAG